MGKDALLEDVEAALPIATKALASLGLKSDFSLGSLWDLERFFEENVQDGKPVSGGELEVDTGSRLFVLGAYLGEVLRRTYNGVWVDFSQETPFELEGYEDFEYAILFPNGTRAWPGRAIIRRFQFGKGQGALVSDDLVAYAVAIENEVRGA